MIYLVIGVDHEGDTWWDIFDTPETAKAGAVDGANFCPLFPTIYPLKAGWTEAKVHKRVGRPTRLTNEAKAAYALQGEFGE